MTQRRDTKGRPLHRCCMCPSFGPWGDTWEWFGSFRDVEDGVPVAKFCAPDCRLRFGQLDPEQQDAAVIEAHAFEQVENLAGAT